MTPLRARLPLALVLTVAALLGACAARPGLRGLPPEPPAAVRHGDEAFRFGEYDDAIAAYGDYLDRVRTGPYTPLAAYKGALAAYRLGRYEQALAILDELDSRYPGARWMQVDALRGDVERARGRDMAAVRAWAGAWELAGPDDRERLAGRFRTLAQSLDAGRLAEARSLVDDDEIRELLTPGGGAPPPIAEPLHDAEGPDRRYAATQADAGSAPRQAAAAPWPPPDLYDLPTAAPAAPAAASPREEAAVAAAPPPLPPAPADDSPETARAEEEPARRPVADTTVRPSQARIAVLLPVSGPEAAAGTAAWQAVQLAFARAGKRLELIDTGATDPADAVAAATRNPRVVAMIGPFAPADADDSPETDGLSRIPLPAAAGPDGPAVLSIGARTGDLVASLVREASGPLRLNRFAILYPDTPAGRATRDAVARAVAGAGRTLVGTLAYPAGTTSFAAYGQRLRGWRERDELQGLFLADGAPQARALLTLLRQELPDVTLLGTQDWSALADGAASSGGVVFARAFHVDGERPAARDFVEAFARAHGSPPPDVAADAYDVATLARRALEAGVTSRAAMRDRLRDIGAVDGVTGPVLVSPDGLTRPGVVLRVSGGRLAEVRG